MSEMFDRFTAAGARPAVRVATSLTTLIAAFTLAAMLAAPASARDDEAKTALGRAEAKMEMVTRSGNPPATQSEPFTIAQRKIEAAHDALRANHNKEAEMLATEAEVWAEAAAGLNDFTAMDRTRAELDRSVGILAVEIGRK